MSAQALLDRLDKVKRTGASRWIACCPAHEDKHPSLSIKENDDGRVLVNCLAHGCGFHEIVSTSGVDLDEMFPSKPPRPEGYRPERRPFLPSDVFRVAHQEIGIVAVIGFDLHKQKDISEVDYERLLIASERLNRIAEAAYGR